MSAMGVAAKVAGWAPPKVPMAKLLARPTGVGLKKIPKHVSPALALRARNAVSGRRGRYIVGGAVAAGIVSSGRNRSGRAVDPQRGRPTGPYGF